MSEIVGILVSLLATIATSFLGYGVTGSSADRVIKRVLKLDKPATADSYHQRLSALTESLAKSTAEVDEVLAEIARVSIERGKAITKLETELQSLEQKERELQGRVEALKNVPLPVAEHFAALTAAGDKRSARRDYMLFAAGAVVSSVLAILLHLAGLT